MNKPLAERLRPYLLDDYIGQEHLIGINAPLRNLIKNNNIPSIIFWGPPGVGKTTLAKIIANETKRTFYSLSAINSGVKDVREIIDKAKKNIFFNSPNPILFIDEIHRFSKSQQDSLLGAVEQGIVTLIGATTENPSFEVISPLLSRCQVYILKAFNEESFDKIIDRAIKKDEYLKNKKIKIVEKDALYAFANGDGRKLLNVFDLIVSNINTDIVEINNKKVLDILQKNITVYDKNGDMHYDIISAFIKSIRGSDPNAAVYWLARMIDGGEDPKFIARRLVILAAEDIGLANPNALLMANNCFDAVNKIGFPESRIILSEAVIYLATSPKSNSAYMAIQNAQDEVKKTGNLSVPLHLRNAPTKLMKDINYGKDYKHSYKNNFVDIEFLPKGIKNKNFYKSGNNIKELEIKKVLLSKWNDKYNF